MGNLSFLCLLHWQVGSLPLAPSGKSHVASCNFSNIFSIKSMEKQQLVQDSQPVLKREKCGKKGKKYFIKIQKELLKCPVCSILQQAAAAAKSLQSCPTLCDPTDSSPPDSSIPGILQARTLEWAAVSFSNAWKWKVKGKSLSRVRLSATPWTVAHQAPPSMGLSRQEYWSGVSLPSPLQ